MATTKLCITVPSGFEFVAVEEIHEVLGIPHNQISFLEASGRVYFSIPLEPEYVDKVLRIRCIEHISVVLFDQENFFSELQTKENGLKDLEKLRNVAKDVDFDIALEMWTKFKSKILEFQECHSKVEKGRGSKRKFRYPHLEGKGHEQKQEQIQQQQELKEEQQGDRENKYETEVQEVQQNQVEDQKQDNEKGEDNNNNNNGGGGSCGGDDGSDDGLNKFSFVNKSILDRLPDVVTIKGSDWVTFRGTGERMAKDEYKQSFTSVQLASIFGGEVKSRFNWKVNLNQPMIEIIVTARVRQLLVAIRLTENIVNWSYVSKRSQTTLRVTTSSLISKLCNPKPGEIFLDPMCGSGMLGFESSIRCPLIVSLNGDMSPVEVKKFRLNSRFLLNHSKECTHEDKGKIQNFECFPCCSVGVLDGGIWDVSNLPIHSDLIDGVVCDMPFGRQCSSSSQNRILYPKAFSELARVCRKKVGRVVILTQERILVDLILNHEFSKLMWKSTWSKRVGIGGLHVFLFKIERSDAEWALPPPDFFETPSRVIKVQTSKRKWSERYEHSKKAKHKP